MKIDIDFKKIDFSKVKVPEMNQMSISRNLNEKVFGMFSDLAYTHNQHNKISYNVVYGI